MITHKFTVTIEEQFEKEYALLHSGEDYGFIRLFLAEVIAKDISFVGFPVVVRVIIEEIPE